MDELLIDYEKKMTLNGLSINTKKIYLKLAKMYLAKNTHLNQSNIESFIAKHNYPVCRFFFKSFIEFMDIEGLKVPKIKGRKKKRLIKVLSMEEVEALAASATCQRDRLIIYIMFEGGLRLFELCSLKRKQINLKKRKIISIGKGNKEYVVNITDRTANELELYFESTQPEPDSLIFPISNNRVYRIIVKLGEALYPEYHVTPHTLRHSCATHLLLNGMNLRELQKYMRHEKLETLAIYTHLDRSQIDDAYANAMQTKNTIDEPIEDLEIPDPFAS